MSRNGAAGRLFKEGTERCESKNIRWIQSHRPLDQETRLSRVTELNKAEQKCVLGTFPLSYESVISERSLKQLVTFKKC